MESLCHGLNQVEDKLPRGNTRGTDSQCMWRARRQGAIRQQWSNPSLKATMAKARAWLLPTSAVRLCTMWWRKKTESPFASTSPAAPPWWCTGGWPRPPLCRPRRRRPTSSCPSSPPRPCPCSHGLSWTSCKEWSTSLPPASPTSTPSSPRLARGTACGLPASPPRRSSCPCRPSRRLPSARSPSLPPPRKRRARRWSSFRDMSTRRTQRRRRTRSRRPANWLWKTLQPWRPRPLSGIRWLRAAPCPAPPSQSRCSAPPQMWPMPLSSWGIISKARPPCRRCKRQDEKDFGSFSLGGPGETSLPGLGGERAENKVTYDRAKTSSCT